VDLFNELKSSGVAFDTISYSAVMTACVVGEQHELAATLLQEAKAAGYSISMPRKRASLQCEQVTA
jgi:pentatricopeptide repeat protein